MGGLGYGSPFIRPTKAQLEALQAPIEATEQSLKTLCERFELEVPDLTAAPPISQETLIAVFNQVLDYTTPGSELIKIALGTADAPQSWEEYVALAANTALDFLPGGKALKMFKGARAKLGLAKLNKLLAKQAKKKAGKGVKTAGVSIKGGSKLTVQFGKTSNQVSHVFRHTDALGLDRTVVKSAVESHFRGVASQIVPGKPFIQRVKVGGRNIQYTAFKLKDGTINIGRIHGVK